MSKIEAIEKAEERIRKLEGKLGFQFSEKRIKEMIEEEIGEKL